MVEAMSASSHAAVGEEREGWFRLLFGGERKTVSERQGDL